MQEVGQPFSDTSPYKVSENFLNWNSKLKVTMILGSGCGSVGRAVASNSRGPRSSAKIYIEHLLSAVLKRRK